MDELVKIIVEHDKIIDRHHNVINNLIGTVRRHSRCTILFAAILLYESYKISELEHRVKELESERR